MIEDDTEKEQKTGWSKAATQGVPFYPGKGTIVDIVEVLAWCLFLIKSIEYLSR